MTGDVRWWMLVLSLAVLVGACSSAEEAEEVAAATVPTAEPTPDPAPEATEDVEAEPAADDVAAEEPEDPYAVPDEIDEDYVQRILDVFASIEGDALREIAASGMYTPEADELYASIYAEEALTIERKNWSEVLEVDPELGWLRDQPGDRTWGLGEIVSASTGCIFVGLRYDRNASNVEAQSELNLFVRFEPVYRLPESDAPVNETPWKITLQGEPADPEQGPGDEC